MRYHKRGRGRPKQEKIIGPTSQQKQKRRDLLNGMDGSCECPLDVLFSHRLLTDLEARALKDYRSLWFSAYGPQKKLSGANVWSAMVSGGGGSYSGEYIENADRKKKIVSSYHEIDDGLLEVSPQGRFHIRKLCEGYIPIFFSSQLTASMSLSKYHNEKDRYIKAKEKTAKKDQSSPEFNALLRSITMIDKRIDELSEVEEPYESVYFREQTRLGLRYLTRVFHIN